MPTRFASDDAALAAAIDGGRTIRLDSAEELPSPPGAAVCVETSGSTSGTPRVVALSPTNLRASATATHRALGGPGAWLLTVPPDHVAGLMVRTRALLGAHPVATSPGPFRAETFAHAVAHLHRLAAGSRTYCSLVPTQLRRVLTDPAAREAAASLDAILIGGAATPPATLAAAREAGITAVTTYGMTETSGGCVYDGVPLDGVHVTIEPNGVVTLSGPQVAMGYLTPAGLDPFGGSFTTSDRGELSQGRLHILGRADDVILTGGVNVDPHQLEHLLTSHDGVAEVCVVGVPDAEWGQRVTAAVVLAAGADAAALTERLQASARERFGPAWVPRVVVMPDLPMRGPGKVDRIAVRARLAPRT